MFIRKDGLRLERSFRQQHTDFFSLQSTLLIFVKILAFFSIIYIEYCDIFRRVTLLGRTVLCLRPDFSAKMDENKSMNYTIENAIYKGQIKHNLNNYKSFGELLWIKIKSHGDETIYLDARTEETVTFSEVQDKAVRCAIWLQKQGIKSGDVISMCTGNHLNSIVPCISVAYINAIFNPWNENNDLQNTLYFLQMMTPKMIFCSEKSVDTVLRAIKEINCSPTVVVFGKHDNAVSFSDVLRNCNDVEVTKFRYVELDDIKRTVCIMHSSGTTGMPKGVELSNYSMVLLGQQDYIHLAKVPSLWFSTLYWVTGLMMSFTGIIHCSKGIMYPEFDEEMACRLIEKYKIQVAFLSTNMIIRLLRSAYVQKYSLSSLKTIVFGGTPIKPKVHEELRCILPHVKILQAFGMTEIAGAATIQLPNHKSGSCGTVAENVQLKIVDPENGKILGPNHSGELCIKIPSIMNGYYKNPEATKNTIDKEGWLHSGDIVYMDEDGELFIIDRIKDLIKYRNYQIAPGEIENVLTSHPAVLEAVIIGVPHTIDDEHPLAYVIKKPGAEVTEQELIDFVANNMMDHYKLRAGVVFLDSFPYTQESGKIAKKDLRKMAMELVKDDTS